MNVIIREAQKNELEELARIEKLADTLFSQSGYSLPTYETQSTEVLENAHQESRLWVAQVNNGIVGFCLCLVLEDQAHLEQVSVLPTFHRKGIGTALIQRAIAWAQENNFDSISLSTSSDVMWTVPLYEKCGFVIVEESSYMKVFKWLRQRELELGFDMNRRVIMSYAIGSS